jgi:hypothetical protein
MSLLDHLIGGAFGGSAPKVKEAAAEKGMRKEAASSDQMNKLADSLEYLANVLVKGAEGEVDDAGIDVGQVGTDVLGGDFADRWVTDASGGPLSAMSLGQGYGAPGQVGQSPEDNLATRGVGNLGGTSAPITNQFATPGMGGPTPGVEVLASLRKNAHHRASAAMQRVLGKVKAAAMRRTAAEDPAIAPVLGGESLSGDPSSFAPGLKDPLAAVPQDLSKLIDLTNTEGDKARAADAKAILGGEVVDAAGKTLGEVGEIVEHESGDEIPTVKAAHAAILRGAVLSSIANGG